MLRVYWSVLVVVRGKAAAVGDGYSFYCDSLLSSDWTLSLYTADSAGVHQQISYHTSNWKIFKSKYVIFWAISYNSTENLQAWDKRDLTLKVNLQNHQVRLSMRRLTGQSPHPQALPLYTALWTSSERATIWYWNSSPETEDYKVHRNVIFTVLNKYFNTYKEQSLEEHFISIFIMNFVLIINLKRFSYSQNLKYISLVFTYDHIEGSHCLPCEALHSVVLKTGVLRECWYNL